jgi:hypothetical protein
VPINLHSFVSVCGIEHPINIYHIFHGTYLVVLQTHYVLLSLHCRPQAQIIKSIVEQMISGNLSYTVSKDTEGLVGRVSIEIRFIKYSMFSFINHVLDLTKNYPTKWQQFLI